MKEGGRANALLMELLLVIFFFMIGAAILVQLFADAHHKSARARAITASLAEAQNCAEELYGSGDPEAWLSGNGFRQEEGRWVLDAEGYTLYVTEENEEAEGLRTFSISAAGDSGDLFTIPSTRYRPKEVGP